MEKTIQPLSMPDSVTSQLLTPETLNLPPLAMPPPINWWPPAPGWWLLALWVVGVSAWLSARYWKYWQTERPRRLCLKELDDIYVIYQRDSSQQVSPPSSNTQRSSTQNSSDKSSNNHNPEHQYLTAANQLIRRFFLQYTGDRKLATESGEQWLVQLDSLVDKPSLATSAGKQLLHLYRCDKHTDIASLHVAIESWVTQLPASATSNRKMSVD